MIETYKRPIGQNAYPRTDFLAVHMLEQSMSIPVHWIKFFSAFHFEIKLKNTLRQVCLKLAQWFASFQCTLTMSLLSPLGKQEVSGSGEDFKCDYCIFVIIYFWKTLWPFI